MNKQRVLKSVLALAVIALLLGMAGCKLRPTELPKETELSFETIERTERFGGYNEKDPRLVIVAEAREISTLGNAISANAQAQVRNLDFSQYLAIAVFQGLKGSGGYGAEIQRVTRGGDTIIIYAHFAERDPKFEAPAIMTSPYHLVKVQKMGLRGKIKFILNVDGTVVSQQTHDVP
jgi:hypothetical protein